MATSDVHDWFFLRTPGDRLNFVTDCLATGVCALADPSFGDSDRAHLRSLLFHAQTILESVAQTGTPPSVLTPEQIAELQRNIGEAEKVKQKLREHGFNLPN